MNMATKLEVGNTTIFMNSESALVLTREYLDIMWCYWISEDELNMSIDVITPDGIMTHRVLDLIGRDFSSFLLDTPEKIRNAIGLN